MKTSNPSNRPLLSAIRWIARLTSILFTGVFILMFLGEGFDPTKITVREWTSLFFFPFGLVVGMLLAWWKEGLGGAIAVVSTLATLIVGDFNSSGAMNMLICASPGFLFLLCWFLSMSPGTPAFEEETGQPLASSPVNAKVLETRNARLAAGLCPKCGSSIAATDKNCPTCRINLAFARAHLDAW